MKKYFFYLFLMLALTFTSGYSLKVYAQDEDEQEETYEDENSEEATADLAPLKMLFFDLGFGANKLSTGLGFRYWHLGASIGLTGFSNTMPAFTYERFDDHKPTGQNAQEESFSSLIVTGDLYYFHDFNKISLYANVGYFSQSDTILVKNINTGTYYYDRRKSSDGLTFGGGFEYLLSKFIAIGIGYHTKLGVTAQLGYRWN